jgi:hypothetical protein
MGERHEISTGTWEEGWAGLENPPGVTVDPVRAGGTRRVEVFYDRPLGALGRRYAEALMATVEPDLDLLTWVFDVADPGGGWQVYLTDQLRGGTHHGCSNRQIFAEARVDYPLFKNTRLAVMAEAVEVYESIQGRGWECSRTNGESLSQSLATARHQAFDFVVEGVRDWLNSAREDLLSQNERNDRDALGNGCGTLFLNYLRHELRYSWPEIVREADRDLTRTARRVTSDPNPPRKFLRLCARAFPPGSWVLFSADPFPIGRDSGFAIQGSFGAVGNYEIVLPASNGLVHNWRDTASSRNLGWRGQTPVAPGSYQGVSLVQGNFGDPGNLELVATTTEGRLEFFWRDSRWHGPFPILEGVWGNPAMIQSHWGERGDFELVVPGLRLPFGLRGSGGLVNVRRENHDPELPWVWHSWFARLPAGEEFSHVALIQPTDASPGNLHVVANNGGRLMHFTRSADPRESWTGGDVIATGATGRHGLVGGPYGARGNFELVFPIASGGIKHYWSTHDELGNMTWHEGVVFARELGRVDEVTLVMSTFGPPGSDGSLFAVARQGRDIYEIYRDERTFAWEPPYRAFTLT